MTQKYKKGDRVKVKYGHIIFMQEEMNIGKCLGKCELGLCYDINPKLTEDFATVEYSYKEKYGGSGNVKPSYSLNFDKYGSISWFDESILIPTA